MKSCGLSLTGKKKMINAEMNCYRKGVMDHGSRNKCDADHRKCR